MVKSNRKPGRHEKGQALMLVLILLAVGGVTVAALLNYSGAVMKSTRVYNSNTRLHYAAEAGMEEALWKTQHVEQLPFTAGEYGTTANYTLPGTINSDTVNISIGYVWPLTGMESDEHGTVPPDSLTITGGIVDAAAGKYKVQISYDGTHGDLPIDRIAVWLPYRFDYVDGSSYGISDDANVPDNPTVTVQRGGKLFTWDFTSPVDFLALPTAGSGSGFLPGTQYPATRQLYFYVTPVRDHAGGSFSWVRTTDTGLYLAWETGNALYSVSSTAADNTTGKNLTLSSFTYFSKGGVLGEDTFQIRGGSRAIGNSLMIDTDNDYFGIRDTLLSSSNATIPDLPADANVVMAYLYWSGWWDNPYADNQSTFQVDGGPVYTVNASRWSLLDAAGEYSYSSFADVSDLVSGLSGGTPHTFTVGDVSGLPGQNWSYAGWSLVVFYSSPSEEAQQFFLYDDFLYADSSHRDHTFDISGFEAPDDAEAVVTCFVGEGDDWLTGDYIQLNGYYLYGGVNPKMNVWNGLSSGLGGESIDGVDIDTFDASSPIIQPRDTSATIHLHTSTDAWNLVYILLDFRSEYGGLTPDATGIISYSDGN